MPRPANSDLSTLFTFINNQIAAGGIFAGGQYRNLNNYYLMKKGDPGNNINDVKSLARMALLACNLDVTHMIPSTLGNAGHEKRRAAAAAVLASSIIKNTSQANLQAKYQELMRGNQTSAMRELKKVLTHGDDEVSKSDGRVTLKNFTSAGTQKSRYMSEAVEAFARSQKLLSQARTNFISLKQTDPLSTKVNNAFQSYFGAPGVLVNPAGLAWAIPSPSVNPPAFTAALVTTRAVVREVLRRVCDVYLSTRQIQIAFGGKNIDNGTQAYVNGSTDPTKIHVAQGFFDLPETGHVLPTQAGALIHELTHTWARTDDHQYGVVTCQNLVAANLLQALTNADNYCFFVETAFA